MLTWGSGVNSCRSEIAVYLTHIYVSTKVLCPEGSAGVYVGISTGVAVVGQDPGKSCYMVDTGPDRKFQKEGARLDTNRTGFQRNQQNARYYCTISINSAVTRNSRSKNAEM